MSLQKTVTRVQTKIDSQEYYEAHQAVRTIVARYVRQKKWQDAIETLYSCTLLLAQAAQLGSVCDLAAYLLEVYIEGKVPVDTIAKGRLAQVVLQIPGTETGIKPLARLASKWAGSDADVNNLFGCLISQSNDFITAEHHLFLGTRESAVALAEMHKRWAAQDEPANFFLYAARGVFGYLSLCNMRNVNAYLAAVLPDSPTATEGDLKYYDSQPGLVFLQLLVPTCQRRERALYHLLKSEYKPEQYNQWAGPIAFVEENYFGIEPQREFNIMDLMGGFLK